ncbi:MAG TPA: PilN domain-containing protein [Candidatus Angelobacter sp.]|jgi:Tfp pilus assembly protein PilN|nr:PilN domain-containing protein [Candidatus Angelobacter sp.]
MRLNINLASQKFEDVRQFYVRWSVTIGLSALLLVLLIGAAWINFTGSAKSGQRIKELQTEIADLQRQRTQAEAISNRPENHDVTAQKNYWNKQINRRQLSWTQLFNDLQRIMPARAYLSSVHPEVTPDNRLKLTLVVMGDTHDNGLELQKKMERSERFRSPQIMTETTQKAQKTESPLYKFDIVTYYTPAAPMQGRSANREGF